MALGLKTGDQSPLPALAECMSARKHDNGARPISVALDKLDDVILSPCNDRALDELALSHISLVNLNMYLANALDDVGSLSDREAVTQLMLAAAGKEHLTQSKKAAAFARGALLLASEEFGLGSGLARHVYASKEFIEVAQLTRQEQAAVEKVLDATDAEDQEFAHQFGTLMSDDDQLVMAPQGNPPAEALRTSIRQAREARHASMDNGMFQHFVIYELWEMCNLAEARKDKIAESQFKDFLKSWTQDEKNMIVVDWIRQSLSTVGPAPKQRRVLDADPPEG